MIGADGEDNVPHRDWLVAFERVLREVKDHMVALGRGDEFVGARVGDYDVQLLRVSHLGCRLFTRPSASSLLKNWSGTWKTASHSNRSSLTSLQVCGRSTMCYPLECSYNFDTPAGFDLVGYENKLRPLIDYIEPLLRFKDRQKELGIIIPYIFHAGETLGDGSKADMNLYDAILLGTKRIGHG